MPEAERVNALNSLHSQFKDVTQNVILLLASGASKTDCVKRDPNVNNKQLTRNGIIYDS